MRIRAPANVFLHRAQVILILAAVVPTVLTTPVGIILLFTGAGSFNLVAGILVLAFCASSLTGSILGSIFLRRGASLARLQNEFLSVVSHELRTPLTSMRMFVETLRDQRLTDPVEREKCLAILQQEMVRLDGLVGQLLELSRIESGGQAYGRGVVDIQEVVDAALKAFAVYRLGTGADPALQLDLAIDTAPGLQVLGDPSALSQALTNLLTNAWKYTGSDKRISVSAHPRGEHEIELVVSDNGPGIPREEQERVFEKFTRGRTALDSGTSGSGLGLAIVRAILDQHRGRVELQSARGRGASFHLVLPRYLPAGRRVRAARAPRPAPVRDRTQPV